jgi:large subunit ribosomal protein L10
MAKTRAQKQAEVQQVAQGLKEAKSIVFADISSLKVADSTALRRKAKEQEVEVKTVKKTLFNLAAKDAGVSVDAGTLSGSITLLMGRGDEVAPAKLLSEVKKANENVATLGGLLESNWMTSSQVTALASLPSKEMLIAQVVGSIRAPLSGLVGVMQGNLRGLVYALNAIKDAKS